MRALQRGWSAYLLAFLDDFDGEPEDDAAFREIVLQLIKLEVLSRQQANDLAALETKCADFVMENAVLKADLAALEKGGE